MDALVWHGGSDLTVDRIDAPTPAADEVVVDIALAGICGSDLHAYRGHGGARKPPLVLGHEAVGRLPGDQTLYALFPLRGCGHCPACLRGAENVCAERRLLGLDRQGTFAQQVAIPRDDLMPVPEGVAIESAALAEPLATAVNAIDGLGVDKDTRVAVIGLGPIGLLTAYAALAAGATVVGVDPVPSRRRHAATIGATALHESAEELAPQSFDVVVDAVGVSATWSVGVQALAGGGTLVIVGLGENSGPIDVGRIVRAGLTVHGTYAYTREQFQRALRMLSEQPLPLSWVECLPFTRAADAFEQLAHVSGDASKVLLQIGPS